MIKHERKTHNLCIRVDDKTLKALEKAAQKEKRTISNLVRLLIDGRLEKNKKASNQ